jgi:diguanylate cyclase (GGDEF)-like protein/PAS domain S-box-containing protein
MPRHILMLTGKAEYIDVLQRLFEASEDCIKLVRLDGHIEYVNVPGLASLDIERADALIGCAWESLWPDDARDQVRLAIERGRAGQSYRFREFCPTAKGRPRWWDVRVSPVHDETGKVARLLAVSRDITSERESAERLRWASEHDALTGLPNRRGFEARFAEAVERASRGKNQVGLLLIDLDHFKHVNDTLGHCAGDHLLKVFAARLSDRLGPSHLVARLGGDEFALVIDGCCGDDALRQTGDAICAELDRHIPYGQRTISGGCSIGAVLFPRDGKHPKDLLRNADIALYARKRSGRGGTQIFQRAMREKAEIVASQLDLARKSLSASTVEPHYQQKVDLRTGRIIGFEALLRWRRMGRFQLPDTVEAAFRDYELAAKIGALMQWCVFRDMRSWLDAGIATGPISINAAPAEFMRDDFAERMIERMEHHGIAPSLVELEVTEHALLNRGSAFVGRALRILHEAGVRIALDDFGTGHSSLSHLRDFPVDVLKIDRSFIGKMTEDQEVRAIVGAVVDLSRKLSIDVVAEGIENDLQRALLLRMGCPFGQGHLFSVAASRDTVGRELLSELARAG